MIAVSDTSPLCYLILTDAVDLLPKLFHQGLVPAVVIAELLHEDARLAALPRVVAWGLPALPAC
jgi:predicted nucleic acid-binding protein